MSFLMSRAACSTCPQGAPASSSRPTRSTISRVSVTTSMNLPTCSASEPPGPTFMRPSFRFG